MSLRRLRVERIELLKEDWQKIEQAAAKEALPARLR
jgi:hypothetical protein